MIEAGTDEPSNVTDTVEKTEVEKQEVAEAGLDLSRDAENADVMVQDGAEKTKPMHTAIEENSMHAKRCVWRKSTHFFSINQINVYTSKYCCLFLPQTSIFISHTSPSLCRMWFVRMPKPPELPSIKAFEVECDAYQTQLRIFNESINALKLERDTIREHAYTARDALKRCREVFDAKKNQVKPLRDALNSGGQTSRKLREENADLEARTEADLDAKIAAATQSIEHETISLAEEKRLIAVIKKLEAQRPRIKELENAVTSVAEVRADAERLRAELHEHDAELSVLRAERDTQQAIANQYKDQEAGLDAKVTAIFAERRRVKELRDALFTRMNEQKNAQRLRNDSFYQNRHLSREVRGAVAKGEMDAARKLCEDQIEGVHAKLAGDEKFRREYFEHCQQHQGPANIGGGGGGGSNEGNSSSSSSSRGGGRTAVAGEKTSGGGGAVSASVPLVHTVDAAAKAQALIAAVLGAVEETHRAEAKEREKLSSSSTAAATVAGIGGGSNGNGTAAHSSKSSFDASASFMPISSAAAVGASPPSSTGKPRKKHKQKSVYVAEPIIEPEDTFELPDVVRQRSEVTPAVVDKQEERERQRQLQAEAAAKKAKREAEKTQIQRRKEKAARDAAEAKLAAAKTAAVAAVAAVVVGGGGGGEAGEEKKDDDDNTDGATPHIDTTKNSTQAAAAVVASPKRTAPVPVLKAAAPRPVAKRPAGSRRSVYRRLMVLLHQPSRETIGWIVLLIVVVVMSLLIYLKDPTNDDDDDEWV